MARPFFLGKHFVVGAAGIPWDSTRIRRRRRGPRHRGQAAARFVPARSGPGRTNQAGEARLHAARGYSGKIALTVNTAPCGRLRTSNSGAYLAVTSQPLPLSYFTSGPMDGCLAGLFAALRRGCYPGCTPA